MPPCPYSYIKEKMHDIPNILASNDSDRIKAKTIYRDIYVVLNIDNYSGISESVKQKMRVIKARYDAALDGAGDFAKHQADLAQDILGLIADLYDEIQKSCCK